jgi:hypothetical protein
MNSPINFADDALFENWTAPDFYNQISPYAGIQVIPEPSTVSLVALGAGAAALFGRRRK